VKADMTVIPSAFLFEAKSIHIDPDKDLIARIPAGLTNRDALFEALQKRLRFPSYFGNNWDALSDCLTDFSWVNEKRIVIKHDDLPRLEAGQLRMYLEICSDSVLDWKPGDEHELLVVFPQEFRGKIDQISSV